MDTVKKRINQEFEEKFTVVIMTDMITEAIGSIGKWHFLMYMCTFPMKVPPSWYQLSSIFFSAPAKVTCGSNGSLNPCSPSCKSINVTSEIFNETIITEFGLFCDKKTYSTYSQMISMLSVLTGVLLFGLVSDRYGRKPSLAVSFFFHFLFGEVIALSPSFEVFVLLRSLSGLGIGGMTVVSYVLTLELTGTQYRALVSSAFHTVQPISYMLMSLPAYYGGNWRHFYLILVTPSALLLINLYFLPESPMWMLTNRRAEKLADRLARAARMNGRDPEYAREVVFSTGAALEESPKMSIRQMILIFVHSRRLRREYFCLSFNWFTIGLNFYGLEEYASHSTEHIYFNVITLALSALIGLGSSGWLLGHYGRRSLLIVSQILTCFALLSEMSKNSPNIQIASLCLAMVCISAANNVIYVYSGEMFPTNVRSFALGATSLWYRLGSLFAPLIMALHMSKIIPTAPLAFGTFSLMSAFLCYGIQETGGMALPDAIRESSLDTSSSETSVNDYYVRFDDKLRLSIDVSGMRHLSRKSEDSVKEGTHN